MQAYCTPGDVILGCISMWTGEVNQFVLLSKRVVEFSMYFHLNLMGHAIRYTFISKGDETGDVIKHIFLS